MKLESIVLGLSILLLSGCASAPHSRLWVKVVFANASTHPLDWVSSTAGKPKLSVGVLGEGIDKTLFDVDWSQVPDQAKLTFIDEKTRQAYTIDISLASVNEQLRIRKCREVTFRILDYDKAEVVCK